MKFKIETDEYGTKLYYANNVLHREDGPAIEYANGNKVWIKNGLTHRQNGPAVQYTDGTKIWYKNGLFHREDGPAFEKANGDKFWFIKGKNLTEKQFKIVNQYNNLLSCNKKYEDIEIIISFTL